MPKNNIHCSVGWKLGDEWKYFPSCYASSSSSHADTFFMNEHRNFPFVDYERFWFFAFTRLTLSKKKWRRSDEWLKEMFNLDLEARLSSWSQFYWQIYDQRNNISRNEIKIKRLSIPKKRNKISSWLVAGTTWWVWSRENVKNIDMTTDKSSN